MEQGSPSELTGTDPWESSRQLLLHFEQFGDLADLRQAISISEASIRSVPAEDSRYLAGLTNLGTALWYRFCRLGKPSDLSQATSTLRIVVDLTPDDHPDKLRHLFNLSIFLFARFERFGELTDLEEVISRRRSAISLTPNSHPDRPRYLSSLGKSLAVRFQNLGELGDLEEAISMQESAVHHTPDGHPDKLSRLNDLGSCFALRFKHLGELSDLEEALSSQRTAADLTPNGHPDKARYLNNLAISCRFRFQRLGELKDLEYATSKLRDAVDLTSDGHLEKPGRLTGLGNVLLARFEHLGQLNDLDEAISRQRDAVDLTPDGHPERFRCLGNLGNSFRTRFEHFGDLSDLEEAISRQRKAVDLVPSDHPHKPSCLNNLGTSLFTRFERIRDLGDLEEAISRQQQAANLIPKGHTEKANYLNNLGNSFLARFRHFENSDDLEEAISRQRDAVDLTPDSDVDKPTRLKNLGSSLLARFKCLGELRDLEEAISREQGAVDLTSDGHPGRARCLNNLACSFGARFECIGELGDLDEAISRQRDAIALTPDGHPDKPSRLGNLGYFIATRFQRLGELSDLEQAVSLFSYGARSPDGPVAFRFRLSQQWISCARQLRHHSLLHAYSVAVTLLPQLAWIGLPLAHRYRQLIQATDVVREAAAAALYSGRPETAVEWLEQGRSIVWGELLQLRSSYDELSSAHPDHARRLREVSVAIERTGATCERSWTLQSEEVYDAEHRATEPPQHAADRHRGLAIERDKLLQGIRRLPGFERFLLHKEFSQLRVAAHSGPVVILNATETRCDALVVLADVNHAIHVPLPHFTLERSMELQTSLKSLVRHARVAPRDDRYGRSVPQERVSQWKPILASLWRCLVKPVLDALALSTPGEISRIFWCPTGPFTSLPIHAAGLYDAQHSQPGSKIFDFVVSSYIPSLSVLASLPRSGTGSNNGLSLLAVRQPLSDGQIPLPGVDAELEHIRKVIENSPSAHLVESSGGAVEEVLGLMRDADWAHFACHGVQDTTNPTESGLCLADARRLRVSDIITLSRPRGGLAFLSACQTAKGDEDLSDEAIHIAAGMLFAGYGGVIGTMWSISDRIAPGVAKDVYEYMFQNGKTPDYQEAARALHEAVQRLRDRDASFQDWLPFIHVGL